MNPYYQLVGKNRKGNYEVLFGSFVRDECVAERDAEKEVWKAEGFTKFKIVTILTLEEADPEVYKK